MVTASRILIGHLMEDVEDGTFPSATRSILNELYTDERYEPTDLKASHYEDACTVTKVSPA